MRRFLITAALCLCAAPAAAQETTPAQTPAQPATQDAKQAERDRKEREKQEAKAVKEKAKQDATAAKEAERKATEDAKATKTQPTGEKVGMAGNAEQALTQLDRELNDAAVRADRALFERTAADGYVFVNPGGGLVERGQQDDGVKFDSLDADDVRVRVHGDTAVLTGRAAVKGRLGGGQDISGQYRYMRVFVRQQGQWRLAAMSAVPIQQGPAQQPAQQPPAEKKP